MKKSLIALLLLVLLAGGAAGVWTWRRSQNPLDKARTLMAAGDLRDAQLVLRTAVLNDPANAEAHFRLGSVQLWLGDPIAAEKELKDAGKAGYDKSAIAAPLAQAYLAQRKFNEVLAEFPVAAPPPAGAAPILVARGLAELGLNHLDAAQAAIAAGELLDPHNVAAPLAAARVDFARGDRAAAEQKIDQALAIDGHSIEALRQKAVLLEARGDHAQAIATYDTAIGLAPGALALRVGRADALIAAGEDARATADVDAVLKAAPKSQIAIFQQAILLIRAKEWVKADSDLQKLSLVLPQLPRGEYFLALVKANINQAEQAAAAATRYVARSPNDPDGYKLLASIDLAAHRPGQAVDVLKQAVAAGHADAAILRLLSQSYVQNGQGELALKAAQQQASLTPDTAAPPTEPATATPGAPSPAATLVITALEAGDVPAAVTALHGLRPQNTDPATISALTGLVDLAQLDLDGAKSSLDEALRLNGNVIPARLGLARVLTLQGRQADADQVLEDGLKRQPANVALLNLLIPMLLSQDQPDRAVALTEAAHAAAPSSVALIVALSDLYVRVGKPQRAVDLLGPAAKDQVIVLAALSRAQQALGLKAEARESFRQVVAKVPADVAARREFAAMLLADGDQAAAKATLQEGLSATPGDPVLMEGLVAVTAQADGIEAGLALAGQLAQNPADLPASRVLVGDLDMANRRFEAAATAFAAAFKEAPSAILALRAARADSAAGAPDQATSLLQGWLTQHPDDLGAAQVLGDLDLQAGRLDNAEANFNKVLATRPGDAVALNNLAWIYQHRKDARAKTVALKAYLIAPQPQIADTLGWILVGAGEPDRGLMLLRQAALQLPNDPSVQYHLAAALNLAGRHDEALTVLKALPAGSFAEQPDAERLRQELLRQAPGKP